MTVRDQPRMGTARVLPRTRRARRHRDAGAAPRAAVGLRSAPAFSPRRLDGYAGVFARCRGNARPSGQTASDGTCTPTWQR
jgi:hypothetical protein